MGKIPILTNIFQRGWNHQLVMYCWTNHKSYKKQTPYRVTCISNTAGFIAMLNTFGLAGAAGYQAGISLWSWSILAVFQWIKLYMQNTLKGKHILVSSKSLRSLNLLLWISFKSMNPSLGFLSSLILYLFFLFIKRFEVQYRVLVVSDLFSLFSLRNVAIGWLLPPKN